MSLSEPDIVQASAGEPSSGGTRGLGRLIGVPAPTVKLPFALEGTASLADFARRRSLVVFFYSGAPTGGYRDRDADAVRAHSWREHEGELEELGCLLIGVSAQSPAAQMQFATRKLLDCILLSDGKLKLADVLWLPTSSTDEGQRVYEPLTLIFQEERIARVLYPIDPSTEAAGVVEWLTREDA